MREFTAGSTLVRYTSTGQYPGNKNINSEYLYFTYLESPVIDR